MRPYLLTWIELHLFDGIGVGVLGVDSIVRVIDHELAEQNDEDNLENDEHGNMGNPPPFV